MNFEERLNKLIEERGATKAGIARAIGMKLRTFQYKCKRLEAWNVVEFLRLCSALRLTDEEKDFLAGEVG